MVRNSGTVALMAALIAVAGCAQRTTLGTMIAAEGSEIAAIGERWSEGDLLVEKGEGQIARGNQMIKDGRDLIEEGRGNVARGQELKADAERQYEARTGKALPVPE